MCSMGRLKTSALPNNGKMGKGSKEYMNKSVNLVYVKA